MVVLSQWELKHCAQNPDVLRALANYHQFLHAEASSVGADSDFHNARAKELITEADRIDSDSERFTAEVRP